MNGSFLGRFDGSCFCGRSRGSSATGHVSAKNVDASTEASEETSMEFTSTEAFTKAVTDAFRVASVEVS